MKTRPCHHVNRLVRLSLHSDDTAWICVDCGNRGRAPWGNGSRVGWGVGSLLMGVVSLCVGSLVVSLFFLVASIYFGWEASRG